MHTYDWSLGLNGRTTTSWAPRSVIVAAMTASEQQ
jgi:hypothetical protein